MTMQTKRQTPAHSGFKFVSLSVSHTGERAAMAILKLNFHEFDEKELLRAEYTSCEGVYRRLVVGKTTLRAAFDFGQATLYHVILQYLRYLMALSYENCAILFHKIA